MSIKREIIKVYDMTCTSCENRVEKALKKVNGVKNAMASYSAQQVVVEYDSELCNQNKLKEAINQAGYSTKNSSTMKFAGFLVIGAAILLLGSSTAGFDMSDKLNNASYVVLFIVGMLTSIHCVGMCGGIMLTQSLSKNSIVDEKQNKLKNLMPSILYNAGRVTSYTIIGGIVGALGSVLSLSLNVKAGLQIFAGIFMVIMGLNMTGFSLFRRFNIKLPWSSCKIKNKPKAPFLVGMLNGLMPCGPLQTMQLYALGTGSAINGAISMFLFSLGTVPLMLLFGAVSGLLSKGYTKQLLKFSGVLVIILGVIMGNRGLALAGVSVPNASSLAQSFSGSEASAAQANIGKATIEDGVQVIRMTADNNGYTPNAFYVQKDIPVKWIITGSQINSCNNAVVIPSLNIQKTLKSGENVIEFTPKDGDINFSCWMGMIRGVIKVTDNLDSVDTSKADSSIPAPSSGMSCCTGGAPGAAGTAPQTQSIYGNDLSEVSTDRLIKKVNISGDTQSLNIKGTGYEFEPLVVVVQKGIKANLSIDLTSFNNAEGKFSILNGENNDVVTNFTGKKGVVNVEFTIPNSGTYLIVKDNSIAAAIEVTDSLQAANLEDIRKKLIND